MINSYMDMDQLLQIQDKNQYTLELIEKKLLTNISEENKEKLLSYKKQIRNNMLTINVQIDYNLMYG